MKPAQVRCFSQEKGTYSEVLNNNANTYKLQVEHLAEVILDGKQQIGATARDGLESVKAMVAINQSAATGKTVYLNQVTGTV